jgi:hypothetical protein
LLEGTALTKVIVEAGACGFKSVIQAQPDQGRRVKVSITSDCEAVTALGQQIPSLGLKDVLTRGYGRGEVFAAAGRTLAHNACPVVSALIKAAEVELGLNVPSPVTITFED